jgi:tetratricopeptide (TPR) repeat protein
MKTYTITKLIFSSSLLCFGALKSYSQDTVVYKEYVRIADAFKKNNMPDSALLYYKKAVAGFDSFRSVEEYMNACNEAGIILTRQDQYDSARSYLERSMSAALETPDSNGLTMATTYISLGVVHNAQENYPQSLAYHFKSLAIRLARLGENDPQVATSYGNIGNVYLNDKDYKNSIDAHLKAMKIREKVFGANSTEVTQSYYHLGTAYREKTEYKTSLEYFEKALRNKLSHLGEGHRELSRYYKSISEVHYLMQNTKQGDVFKKKSEDVLKG